MKAQQRRTRFVGELRGRATKEDLDRAAWLVKHGDYASISALLRALIHREHTTLNTASKAEKQQPARWPGSDE